MRNKWTLCVLFFVLMGNFSCTFSQGVDKSITIVKDNQSDFEIVVRKDAPETTRYAAKELQTYIEKTTDVLLPIVNDFSGEGKHIFVGYHKSLPKESRFDLSTYTDEAYAVDSWQGNLVIMGGEPKDGSLLYSCGGYGNFGLLYGVYDSIEQFLGTRWYAPGDIGECVEKKATVIVTGLPMSHKPSYFSRMLYPTFTEDATSREFVVWFRRLKGAGSRVLAPNHSMEAFSYEHRDVPEIFALDANGKRIFGSCTVTMKGEKAEYRWSKYPQFCLSSQKLLDLYVQAIDGWYEGGTEAVRGTFYRTPHDDKYIYFCSCPF